MSSQEADLPCPVALARQLSAHLGLSPPVDVRFAAEAYGIQLLTVPGVPMKKATLTYSPGGHHPPCLFTHPLGDRIWQRTSIAHQLGHLLLHRHLIEVCVRDFCAIPELETEANLFAGELLVPEHELRRVCIRLHMASGRPKAACLDNEVERIFQVPHQFWRHRLCQLGYRNNTQLLAAVIREA